MKHHKTLQVRYFGGSQLHAFQNTDFDVHRNTEKQVVNYFIPLEFHNI